MLGVYVHVPFCRVKCPYCSFNVYVKRHEVRAAYVDALVSEVRLHADALAQAPFLSRAPDGRALVSSIYLGGGTPTLLDPSDLARIVEAVRTSFSVVPDAELTVESEPGTTTTDVFAALAELGANRLTIGVQSFQPALLERLGRPHSADEARRAVADARAAGVSNLDLDLIFGAPEQTLSDWRADLDAALALGPEHLSLYNLTIEPGTPFHTAHGKGLLPLPDEDVQADMLRAAIHACAAAGLDHYELSNFARAGRRSRHNQGYWQGRPYLGVGAGAHGFLPSPPHGRRWWNLRSPAHYVEAVRSGRLPVDASEDLDAHQALLEALFLGLRQRDGLDVAALGRRFGGGIADGVRAASALPVPDLVTWDGDRLRLTNNGVIIADSVIEALSRRLDSTDAFDTVGI